MGGKVRVEIAIAGSSETLPKKSNERGKEGERTLIFLCEQSCFLKSDCILYLLMARKGFAIPAESFLPKLDLWQSAHFWDASLCDGA